MTVAAGVEASAVAGGVALATAVGFVLILSGQLRFQVFQRLFLKLWRRSHHVISLQRQRGVSATH